VNKVFFFLASYTPEPVGCVKPVRT